MSIPAPLPAPGAPSLPPNQSRPIPARSVTAPAAQMMRPVAQRMMTRSNSVIKPQRESDEQSTILPSYENVISAQQAIEAEKVPIKMSSEERIHNQTVEFLDKQIDEVYKARLVHHRGNGEHVVVCIRTHAEWLRQRGKTAPEMISYLSWVLASEIFNPDAKLAKQPGDPQAIKSAVRFVRDLTTITMHEAVGKFWPHYDAQQQEDEEDQRRSGRRGKEDDDDYYRPRRDNGCCCVVS